MSTEHVQIFLIEAEHSLTAIRGGILLFLQDGKSLGDMKIALAQARALKTSAGAAGLQTVADLLASLETEFAPLLEPGRPFSAEGPRCLLDILTRIETEIVHAGLADGPLIDISTFIDESFENLQLGRPPGPAAGKTPEEEPAEDEFEIDEEMVEVFREEAEELLHNIGENLGILANKPNDHDALLEIRRSAHTFKGSAGIVGLKKPSRLAHRVEDLLDHLAENHIDGTERIFKLLLNATDCLAALTNGEDSGQLEARVAGIYRDFDDCMASLGVKGHETAAPPAPVKASDEAVQNKSFAVVGSSTQPQAQQNRNVIRVSLEKLDDLANIVRNLVTNRSVFEQRLADFERQIDELHNTTRRLQRSGSKLETDFEANMLGGTPGRGTFRGVAANRLNTLSDSEFDILEFDRYTDFHQTMRELLETTSDNFAINSTLDTLRGNLEGLFENQRRLVDDMQDKLQRIRMIEFGTLSARLNRTVRVTCEEEEKQVDLFIEGASLEIDTQILDSMIEPLMHLLRNAVAHGIESPETRRLLGKSEKGRIGLAARNEETHIVLTISDDGRGIATSALKEKAVRNGYISQKEAGSLNEEEIFDLIFQPGLTTAEKISQTAGRGVGMNVVRTSIERAQGTIQVVSEPQRGTTFTLRLPVSLAVTRVLLVKAHRQTFAFPLKLVKQIVEVPASEVETGLAEKVIRLGNRSYSFSHLNDRLGVPGPRAQGPGELRVLLLEVDGKPHALLADEIVKPEEIVIKPLGRPLENLDGLLGATILGSGQVVPVLDMVHLLKARGKRPASARVETPVEDAPPITVLIVDDSPSVRHLNTRVIQNAGWNTVTAKDGVEALEIIHAAESLPGIVLTDVEMPRMDGYELLASLKKDQRTNSIPVVMITSRTGDRHHQKAVELGVSEYLAKPYDDVKLLEIIRALTSHA
jgi:chemosensory pili system protein ChpA (sensor histidine kinase/response regulator)